ncbi:16S rRNA (cytidine(1402)-2'-O)-methyltransferase [Roseomonas mucosa]|uniref:Ribosomal RNA small subunit methyltransferase I n=2 Tax=Roseomonas mucosa TaxID=207340 RepID=A0A379MYP4_9PROT|nr:16S rRNA (cytidine(1402)-2'-O)-methyltransferase [Roseomonas mucosa]QDD93601.1 16S rRNA (cytidine(1402)-2'-O)-methyltransferase [Roseomonas mucosa]QDD98705.1 16S rRNA (cytidine(1402)-2'-O)-methyltransferase [Roseomonas mucosa]QDJ08356.1 16S rRNA (cytidine(1402)-2'-O)-methyltransferase [Roseomonas mucosa]UZO90901.1 16S rRNA (cytidine(1402)-2'-O)-methyltransferase [Roseomonas mucosa]
MGTRMGTGMGNSQMAGDEDEGVAASPAELPPDETHDASPGLSPGGGSGASLPGLVLVATPIGNLGDLSPRAVAALKGADVILCEDTRVTGPMLARQGVGTSLIPLHDHNEASMVPRLLERLRGGARLALVSDAGTPLVSDPGFRLTRAAIDSGLPVTAIPGPNAALVALTLSGLPPHPFLFHGFLPAKAAARTVEIGRIAGLERSGLRATLILYESPHRLAESLAALAEGLGPDRPAAVARELTKRFEEVRRASLGELATHYAVHAPRGEIVLVIGPAPDEAVPGEADLDAQIRAALATGASLRDAAAMVAAATGLPRRQVYGRALQLGSTR